MLGDVIEPVIGVALLHLPARGDGVEPSERVIVVVGGYAVRDRGEQPVAVVAERSADAVDRLSRDIGVGVVGVRLGDRAVLGDLCDAITRIVGIGERMGQLGRIVVRGHQLLDVLGLVPVRVIGIGVLGDGGAVGLDLGRVL